MNRQYHSELVIESLPKCVMYDGKLPIRLPVISTKTSSIEVEFGYYRRQSCEITVAYCEDEWTDAIKKWYFYIFDYNNSLMGKINNQKVDGKVYEYDEDGNITVTFNVYSIFPIMLSSELYVEKSVFTATFNVDSIGALEKVNGYKKENLFVENSVPTISEVLNSGHLSWDEYFANIAMLAALRSKDKNTKVGAVIVSQSNKILSTGYNGLPSGIDESLFPTTNDKSNNSFENTKYAYVTHAELNAILNTSVHDISGSKLYCSLFPCCECAKAIIQKGIKEVIYLSDKHHDDPEYIASRRLFDAAGIVTRKYSGRLLLS